MPSKLKTAESILTEAKRDRDHHREWMDQLYRFCLPWRTRFGHSRTENDQGDLFDNTAMEALGDFASDMNGMVTPPWLDWIQIEPSRKLSQSDRKLIEAPIKDYKEKVFAEIRRSNFYEAGLEGYHDLAIGTVALQVQREQVGRPYICQSTPLTNLYVLRGMHGRVDAVIRQFKIWKKDVPTYYPDAKLPDSIANSKKPMEEIEVTECAWRNWDPQYTEAWDFLAYFKQTVLADDFFTGVGSCPFAVGRWRTDASTAWGIGPLYTALPTVRVLDELGYLVLKQANKVTDPPFFYDDDGVMNFDQGIVPGTAIPRLPGSKHDVLESGTNFEIGFFTQEDLRHQIKRALFQDKPEQRGDTPPTATQFLEEMAMTARRLPLGRLVDYQLQIFSRFAWLMEQDGALPKVELKGEVVDLVPYSPLLRNQQQDKVLIFNRFMEIANAQFGPEAVQLLVDPVKSLENLKKMLNEEGVVIRDQAELQGLMEKAAQGAQAMGALPQ